MKFFIGLIVVLSCVLTGYIIVGGHLYVLWQPSEFLIIIGAAIGAYCIGNPGDVIKKTPANLGKIIAGPSYSKKDYLELLSLLFSIFKLAKNKGMLALESHLDNPKESSIFQKYPTFLKHKTATTFLCDYLRMITMGNENPYHLDDLMQEELNVISHHHNEYVKAFEKMADGMPALGIVAAVLGVIHTMGSISQPPEILGKLIGGALVGTFLGVLISYGFITPMAQYLKYIIDEDSKYIQCIKLAILSYLNGHPPVIIIEYARKTLSSATRPSFQELETATQNLTDL